MTIQIKYATNLVDKAVVEFLRNKTVRQGFSHWDIWHNEHAVAFTVAKMMSDDLLADTQKALIRAIEQGQSFHEFKKGLKDHLQRQGWWGEKYMLDPKDGEMKLVKLGSTRRLKLIFETNIRQAQAYGQWQRIWRNRDILPYLEYIESTSDSKREQHLEFVGLILPVEHPFWDKNFPPNGYNCKCSVIAITEREALERKKEQAQKENRKETPEELLAADIETANRIIAEQIETENPRQKDQNNQNVRVAHHPTTHPSFAYNAGKERLEALDRAYEKKHGEERLKQLQDNREKYLTALFNLYCLNKLLISLKEKADPRLVAKLGKDTATDKDREHETHAAILWFAKKKKDGDKLRRYKGNAQNPPDFEIVHQDGTTTSIDLMYTMGENAKSKYSLAKRVEQLNERFKTEDAFNNELQGVQDHLGKANIVILDLRHLSAVNRAKIGTAIAKLPIEQQDKIHLIVKETQ